MIIRLFFAVSVAVIAYVGLRIRSREPDSHYAVRQKALLPRHVAVIGAAGGLGQGVLQECIAANVSFTAIVRSRPERIQNVPKGSRVVVVSSLTDEAALQAALTGVDALLVVSGVTGSTIDEAALVSKNLGHVAKAMVSAGVRRVLLISTLILAEPGQPPSMPTRFFSQFPGVVGAGMSDMQGVADEINRGVLSGLDWTLVRAGVNAAGADVRPRATMSWQEVSYLAVSYRAMARWMLEESVENAFVQAAPLVSRARFI